MQSAFVPAVAPTGSFTCNKSSSFVAFNGLKSKASFNVSKPTQQGNMITMGASIRETRERIKSVKNTQKITTAMRLVAAAKVRRAQDACLQTRPFSSALQKVLGGLLKQLEKEYVDDIPLLQQREVKTCVLVSITGDRGLCGGYNTYAIKKVEQRMRELKAEGINVELVTVGVKSFQYFKSRATVRRSFNCGQAPTAAEATAICEELLAEYLSGEVDRVEVIYSRFVSLISSTPSIRTLLPLSPSGIETEGDEIFQLTSKGGDFSVKNSVIPVEEPEEFPQDMIFEQDPEQMLGALLPLYLNGQILRVLQESVASELAARMTAMSAASDNAKQLAKDLSLVYNRARQAAITQEISEIVAGSNV